MLDLNQNIVVIRLNVKQPKCFVINGLSDSAKN